MMVYAIEAAIITISPKQPWWIWWYATNIVIILTIVISDVVHNVVVVAGGVAKLPCEINQNNPEDRTKLVLWFHHQSLKPFYT